MADNLDKQEQAYVHRNIDNLSVFPGILFLLQFCFLLSELLECNLMIFDGFYQFLQESSIFLSIINGLLILWYWIKDLVLYWLNISRKYKIINSCICILNIVFLNKLYDNNRINEILSSFESFFSSENLNIYVFVLIIIAVIIGIACFAMKVDKEAPPDNVSFANSAIGTGADNVPPQQMSTQTTQLSMKVNDKGAKVLFYIVFATLLFIIAIVVCLLIDKFDIIANIIKDKNESSRILDYLLLAICVVAFIIVALIIVAAAARSISKLFLHIPEYIRRTEVTDDRIIKITLGIALIPLSYGITKLFGLDTDWVLNLLQNQNFLVLPFIMLFYFVLTMLFVELLYGLFSGKQRAKWLKSFTEIVSSTGDSIVGICGSIVKGFLRLLQFVLPDFLEIILAVLMGEEDETDNAQSKQNGQND